MLTGHLVMVFHGSLLLISTSGGLIDGGNLGCAVAATRTSFLIFGPDRVAVFEGFTSSLCSESAATCEPNSRR